MITRKLGKFPDSEKVSVGSQAMNTPLNFNFEEDNSDVASVEIEMKNEF